MKKPKRRNLLVDHEFMSECGEDFVQDKEREKKGRLGGNCFVSHRAAWTIQVGRQFITMPAREKDTRQGEKGFSVYIPTNNHQTKSQPPN